MDASLVSLLSQIPLVGIFIWFVLTMMDRYSKERSERDAQWREFLKELRDAQSQTISRLAEEIRGMSIEVVQVRESLNRHEVNTERRFGSLIRDRVDQATD